jgi:hypothetical protein
VEKIMTDVVENPAAEVVPAAPVNPDLRWYAVWIASAKTMEKTTRKMPI